MDPAIRKDVLRLVPYGLYAVTCRHGDQTNAFTASWLTQCSFDPPLVALAVRADSLSYELIDRSGGYVVNFVSRNELELLKLLLKPVAKVGDKLAGRDIRDSSVGAPILTDAVGWLACRVTERSVPGDHALFIAEVVDCGRRGDEAALVLADTPWSYAG